MADYVGGDMIRGHIDTIILNSLIDGDKDTNQIREEIEQRAEGRFQLKQGTFYSALQRISKQGLVNEYRTTGSDGVRRKFFQLTEKGKAHIEQTQNSWNMSRQVINSLIDAPQTEDVKQSENEVQEDKLPVFETEEKIVASFAELESSADFASEAQSEADILVFGNQEDDEPEVDLDEVVVKEIEKVEECENDTTENIEEVSPTFDEFLDIMARINADAELQNERENDQEASLDNVKENNLTPVEVEPEETDDEQIVAHLFDNAKQENKPVEQKFDSATLVEAEQTSQEEDQPKHEVKPDNVEIIDFIAENKQTNEQIVIPEFDKIAEDEQLKRVDFVEPIKAQSDEIDDFLDSADIPSTMDYKEVLSKIFQNNGAKQPEDTAHTINEASASNEVVIQQETVDDLNYDVLVDELDFTNKEEEIADREHDIHDHRRVRRNKQSNAPAKGAIDYSDIIALSQEEGFKVTTSDRTNKNELGKILINKLNFHSLLIFYILIALETLIVSLSMESVLKFGVEAYIIFAAVMLLLPIISGIIYYMAPKRTVSEVNSFKSSFETALIITLNLILVTLAVAIFINLDFSSQQSITRVIFIPIMIVINIPLYVVIRHSLLEKQMYFS